MRQTKHKLTKAQKATIEYIAKISGEIGFCRETSFSGLSETFRYTRTYFDEHYRVLRTKSGMILSVKINVLPDGSDDPKSWDKYNTLCEQAKEYFYSLRKAVHPQPQTERIER